jgi:hypothetical protein
LTTDCAGAAPGDPATISANAAIDSAHRPRCARGTHAGCFEIFSSGYLKAF